MITIAWENRFYQENEETFKDEGLARQELAILLSHGFRAWVKPQEQLK